MNGYQAPCPYCGAMATSGQRCPNPRCGREQSLNLAQAAVDPLLDVGDVAGREARNVGRAGAKLAGVVAQSFVPNAATMNAAAAMNDVVTRESGVSGALIAFIGMLDGCVIGPPIGAWFGSSILSSLAWGMLATIVLMFALWGGAAEACKTCKKANRSMLPVLLGLVVLGGCAIIFGWSHIGEWWEKTPFS